MEKPARRAFSTEDWDRARSLAELGPLLGRNPTTLRRHANRGHLKTVIFARTHYTTFRWLHAFLSRPEIGAPGWWPLEVPHTDEPNNFLFVADEHPQAGTRKGA